MLYCSFTIVGVTKELPLIRHVIAYGKSSKGVILPKTWLQFFEKQNGQPINYVGMEINGKIVIWPILKEWESSCETK